MAKTVTTEQLFGVEETVSTEEIFNKGDQTVTTEELFGQKPADIRFGSPGITSHFPQIDMNIADPNDVSLATPQLPKLSPRTLREQVKDLNIVDVLAHLPFSPLHDYQKKGYAAAKQKLRTGKGYGPNRVYTMGGVGFPSYQAPREPLTRQQLTDIVEDYETEQARGKSLPAHIASGIADLPAYIGEFAAGYGMGRAAAGTVTRGLPRILKPVASGLVRAGTLTAIQPHRINSALIDQIEAGEKPYTAIAKAWGDVYIENLSEMAGEGLPYLVAKMPFGGKIMGGLKKFANAKGISDSKFWKMVGTRAGYNGLIAEWGEERLGTTLRGITGVDDFGANQTAMQKSGRNANFLERIGAGWRQDLKARNQIAEVGVLLTPAATKYAAKRVLGNRRTFEESLKDRANVSDKVSARAKEMLEEGWTPSEIDRMLITPSKFLGDQVLDNYYTQERPPRWLSPVERRQEDDLKAMDEEYKAMFGPVYEPASTMGQIEATELIPGQTIDIEGKTRPEEQKAPEIEAEIAGQEEVYEVYHGGPASVEELSPDASELTDLRGVYFAEDAEIAQMFADQHGKGEGVVRKYKVTLNNPANDEIVDSKEAEGRELGYKDPHLWEWVTEELKAEGYDGAIRETGEIIAFNKESISPSPQKPSQEALEKPKAEAGGKVEGTKKASEIEAKQPWEMTKEEYKKSAITKGGVRTPEGSVITSISEQARTLTGSPEAMADYENIKKYNLSQAKKAKNKFVNSNNEKDSLNAYTDFKNAIINTLSKLAINKGLEPSVSYDLESTYLDISGENTDGEEVESKQIRVSTHEQKYGGPDCSVEISSSNWENDFAEAIKIISEMEQGNGEGLPTAKTLKNLYYEKQKSLLQDAGIEEFNNIEAKAKLARHYNIDIHEDLHKEYVKIAVLSNKPVPHNVLLEYKSEKWAQEALKKPKAEAKSGISESQRQDYIEQAAEELTSNELYQNELDAIEQMSHEIGPGYYYIDKGYKGEVEAIIGKRKGFPTKIQRMFTFDPGETRIVKTQTGEKIEIGPTPWESAVQEGLGRNKEGVDQTWGHMDISDFVQRVVDAYNAGETKGGVNLKALERAKNLSDPGIQLAALKFEMHNEGATDTDINDAISEWATDWGIETSDILDEYVGKEGDKLREIARMQGQEQKEALEQLAAEQADVQLRSEAAGSAREILEANDIVPDIDEVDEIKPDDDIPFERRRGRATGAAITRGQRETILLAYGSDSETGYHEGYHILRRRLTEKDKRVLDKYFKGNEEAEAAAFARYAKTNKANSVLRNIWQKLKRVLKKVRSGLEGKGFRTAEDVFEGIRSGTIEKGKPTEGTAYETSSDKWRREVYKKAVAKAKKAAAESKIGAKKKKPKVSKRRLKLDIKDHTPPLRADLADEPAARDTGPALTEEPPPGKVKRQTKVYLNDKFYEENRRKYRRTLREFLGDAASRSMLKFDKAAAVMSSRLGKIDEGLKYGVRRYVFNVHKRTTELVEAVTPMVKALNKFNKKDRRYFKFAALNNQRKKINELIDKYGIQKEYEQFREVMDELFEAGNEVGLEILYRGDYWPRVVKDLNGLLKYLQTTDKWAPIQRALFKRQEQAGGRELTESEKAHVINTLLRGYRIGGVSLSRPGAAKERTIDTFDAQIEPYYYNLKAGLQHYIQNMVQVISAREYFGRQANEIRDLRANRSRLATRLYKTSRRIGYKKTWPQEKYDTHISEARKKLEQIDAELEKKKAQTLEDSVGWYVKDLVLAGKITPQQQIEIAQMLRAIFEPRGASGAVRTFMKLGYIDTLANPSVALTQLEELGLSVYKDAIKSLPGAVRAGLGKSEIKLSDIGVTDINQYMEDLGFSQLGDKLLFMMHETDRLGKQTFVNTALSDMRGQASRGKLSQDFVNKMKKMFGPEYRNVIADLKAGRVTDDIKFLAFSELSDVQPVSITETPEYYAIGGNARILYMLRSFTIRRFDMLRNRARKMMVNPAKNPKQFVKGLGDMIKLIGILTAFGVGKDAVRDWFLGKEFELSDSVIDNLLQYVLLSRYTAARAKREGAGSAIAQEIMPPTKAIDALINDVKKGEIDRTVRSIPIIGENYYWWYGGGNRKTQGSKTGTE